MNATPISIQPMPIQEGNIAPSFMRLADLSDQAAHTAENTSFSDILNEKTNSFRVVSENENPGCASQATGTRKTTGSDLESTPKMIRTEGQAIQYSWDKNQPVNQTSPAKTDTVKEQSSAGIDAPGLAVAAKSVTPMNDFSETSVPAAIQLFGIEKPSTAKQIPVVSLKDAASSPERPAPTETVEIKETAIPIVTIDQSNAIRLSEGFAASDSSKQADGHEISFAYSVYKNDSDAKEISETESPFALNVELPVTAENIDPKTATNFVNPTTDKLLQKHDVSATDAIVSQMGNTIVIPQNVAPIETAPERLVIVNTVENHESDPNATLAVTAENIGHKATTDFVNPTTDKLLQKHDVSTTDAIVSQMGNTTSIPQNVAPIETAPERLVVANTVENHEPDPNATLAVTAENIDHKAAADFVNRITDKLRQRHDAPTTDAMISQMRSTTVIARNEARMETAPEKSVITDNIQKFVSAPVSVGNQKTAAETSYFDHSETMEFFGKTLPMKEAATVFTNITLDSDLNAMMPTTYLGGQSEKEIISLRMDTHVFQTVSDTKPAISNGNTAAVNTQTIIDQIADARQSMGNDFGRVRIVLDPPNLGTIDLDVIVRKERVEIVITADNANVQQALQARMDDIRTALQRQDMKMETFQVLLQDNGNNQQQANSGAMYEQKRERQSKYFVEDNAPIISTKPFVERDVMARERVSIFV